MTAVIDIACPECGRVEPVRKHGIGSYRCSNCGAEFGRDDVTP